MSQTRNLMFDDATAPVDPQNPGDCLYLDGRCWFNLDRIRTHGTRMRLLCNTSQLTAAYATMFGDEGSVANRFYLRIAEGVLQGSERELHDLDGYIHAGLNEFIVDCPRRCWTINGIETPFIIIPTESAMIPTWLAGRNSTSGDYKTPAAGLKIHHFQWWEDDDLVMNLLPHTDEQGIACLINTIDGTCFYNQGTGTAVHLPS